MGPLGPSGASLVVVAGEVPATLTDATARQGTPLISTPLGERSAPVALLWLPPALAAAVLADLTRRIREAGARLILGVIADGTVADREAALAAGLDDAVTGPISPREVEARLRALARRLVASRAAEAQGRYGAVEVDVVAHKVRIGHASIVVTRTELLVLAALVAARGGCLSRADLLESAWTDEGLERTDRAVDNVILRLRRKLPDPGLIVTVRGVGFRLRER